MKLKKYWQEILIILLLLLVGGVWSYYSHYSEGTKAYNELDQRYRATVQKLEAIQNEMNQERAASKDLESELASKQTELDNLVKQIHDGTVDTEKKIAELQAELAKSRENGQKWKNYASQLDTSFDAYIKAVKEWVWKPNTAEPKERGVSRPTRPQD